jgi:hypothetical protein
MAFFNLTKKRNEIENLKKKLEELDQKKVGWGDHILFDFPTGHPIDEIYAFLKKNFNQLGFDDAHAIQGEEYMNRRIDEIKDRFLLFCDHCLVLYSDKLTAAESDKEMYLKAGLLVSHKKCLTDIKIFQAHIEKLNEIKESQQISEKIEDDYTAGFMRGLAEVFGANPDKIQAE